MPAEQAAGIAAVGLGSLLGLRLLRDVLRIPSPVEDEVLVDTWVLLMLAAIGDPAVAGE